MIQRLPIALAQVKTGNTSQKLNEIRQIMYSLYRANKIAKIDTIFNNSETNQTSDLHWLLLNLSDKINLKISDKYVAL